MIDAQRWGYRGSMLETIGKDKERTKVGWVNQLTSSSLLTGGRAGPLMPRASCTRRTYCSCVTSARPTDATSSRRPPSSFSVTPLTLGKVFKSGGGSGGGGGKPRAAAEAATVAAVDAIPAEPCGRTAARWQSLPNERKTGTAREHRSDWLVRFQKGGAELGGERCVIRTWRRTLACGRIFAGGIIESPAVKGSRRVMPNETDTDGKQGEHGNV